MDEDHLARSLAEVVRETDERNRHEGFLPDEESDRFQWRDFNSRLLERLEVAEHLWDAAHEEIEAAFVDPANFVIFPEVNDVLRELRAAGYRLAICSNWSSAPGYPLRPPRSGGLFRASDRLGACRLLQAKSGIFRYALELLEVRRRRWSTSATTRSPMWVARLVLVSARCCWTAPGATPPSKSRIASRACANFRPCWDICEDGDGLTAESAEDAELDARGGRY